MIAIRALMTDTMISFMKSIPACDMKRDRRKKSLVYLVSFYVQFYFATVDRAEVILLASISLLSYVFSASLANLCIITVLSLAGNFAPGDDIRFIRVVLIWGLAQALWTILFTALRCFLLLCACLVLKPIIRATLPHRHRFIKLPLSGDMSMHVEMSGSPIRKPRRKDIELKPIPMKQIEAAKIELNI